MSDTASPANSPFSPDQIAKLGTIRNDLAMAHVLGRVVWHGGLITAIVTSAGTQNYWLCTVLILINGMTWSFLGYAGIGHELYHQRVFSHRQLNRALYELCSYLTWNNPYFFRVSHRLHHAKTYSNRDTEAYGNPYFKGWKLLPLVTFDLALCARRMLYAVVNACGQQLVSFWPFQTEAQHSQDIAKYSRRMILLHSGLTVVFFMQGHAELVLATTLAPFFCTLPNRALAAAQHIGLAAEVDKGAMHHTRSLQLSWPVAYFYANMNYHCEHHLMPAVPFYNLPELSRMLLENGSELKIETSRFFISDFWAMTK